MRVADDGEVHLKIHVDGDSLSAAFDQLEAKLVEVEALVEEDRRRTREENRGVLGSVLAGIAAACAWTRPVTRRGLLFPWRR